MEFSIGSIPGRPARPLPIRQTARHPARPTSRGRLLSDVFDVFQAGVLVVNGTGRVLTWNPAFAELAGPELETAKTCCEVFGCRQPGGPLAETCLTEAAVARSARLDDLVIELPGGRALALSATPFNQGPLRTVVFEAHPARSAARSVLDGTPTDVIHIRTLGETAVETPAGELPADWLEHRTGRLLKLLITHRYTPMHADAIAEALWPRASADTTSTVRHFVHTLREKLEPSRAPYQRSVYVLARNGGYMLNPDRVTVDADEFEREAKAGLVALATNDTGVATERLRNAVGLYRGDFLAEERFDDWAIMERERLRDLATKPLRALANLTSDPDEAAAYLERLADMEPLDVEIHRDLIGAWLRQGRRGRAIRHYRTLQSRLMRELGERVTFDLSELVNGERAREADKTR
jgi:DNA-binding SARP family transcriptional activator